MSTSSMKRRQFLGSAALSAATARHIFGAGTREVAIVTDPGDPVASAAPVKWVISRLESAIKAKGVACRELPRLADVSGSAACLVVAGASSDTGRALQQSALATVASEPEALGLMSARAGNQRTSTQS